MDGSADFATLDPRDRGFAHNLVATTLRRLGQIDAVLDAFIDKPLPSKANRITDILRLGAAQLLFLRTPPHAAVDSTVRLVTGQTLGRYRGLANAVLRRMSREGDDLRKPQDAARLNTPDWLWDSWSTAYGEEICRGIAAQHLAEAPLDLTTREPAADWAARLAGEAIDTHTVRLTDAGPITGLAGYDDGAWWVQDVAATHPADMVITHLEEGAAGKSVFDLCAAPGGKTAQLAAAGASVTAVDISAKRLRRLSANMERLGLSVPTVAADLRKWTPDAPADAVLLDAPCTGTGTIRRHPDIARLKSPEEVVRMTGLQRDLLTAAIRTVKSGGVLVYSVCSLQPEEGEAMADWATAQLAGLAEIERRRTTPAGRTDIGGEDGFFCVAFRVA